MKTLQQTLIGLSVLLMSYRSFSQTTPMDSYLPVIEKLKTTYNSKNYKGLYNLLSPGFKAQQSEKEITSFVKENVYAYYGPMKTALYYKEEEGFRYYKTQFEKGTLAMLLACNEKNEIEGFTFMPYKEPVAVHQTYASDNKKQSSLDLKIDSIVAEYLSNPINAGMSIGIIENGKMHYYNYGETKKGSTQLPTTASIYEIGSVTKTFTGILLARAVKDKKVSLQDDIRKYLPASCARLIYKNTPISLKDLVTHTSGLDRVPANLQKQKDFDELNPYKNYTKQMMYEYLQSVKLTSMPGEAYDYSNTGMALLGMILETVYGLSFDKLVESELAEPLHMNTTLVTVPESSAANFVTGYNSSGKETKHWDLSAMVACGGYRSTIKDMTAYLEANLLEQDSVLQTSHEPLFLMSKAKGIGYAWHLQNTNDGNTLVWHNGGTYGFASFCGFIKEKKCGVVILSNSGNEVDGIAIDILRYLKH